MNHSAFETPWARFLGAATVLLLSGLQLHACEPPRTSPPAIVSDGDALLAAWEEPTDDGVTIYVRRIRDLKDGITMFREGTPIYRQKYGVTGYHTPELASGPDGSIVIVDEGAGKLAIPLDHDGYVAGPPQPLTGCRSSSLERACFRTCRRPIAYAGGFIVGHVSGYSRTPVKSVDLSFLDKMGRTTQFLVLPSAEPYSCVMAATTEDLVVVSNETAHDGSGVVHVQFLVLSDGSPVKDFTVPGGAARSVVALGDRQFAVVYQLVDGRTVVSRFDPDGVIKTWLVPDVDLATVDLGVSKRGAFMTWIKDRRVHVRDLPDRHEFASRRVSSSAVGVRATSIGGRCITAWNVAGGGKLSLLAVPDCP